MMRMRGKRERERSEEAWYNGINRSTSQHHAAATVGEMWNINQNIWTFQKIEERNGSLSLSPLLNCALWMGKFKE